MKRFLVCLMIIAVVGLAGACTSASTELITAPPPSEAERVRAVEQKVAHIEGYIEGQRDARCLKNCGEGKRPRRAKPAKKVTAPPAPTPAVQTVPAVPPAVTPARAIPQVTKAPARSVSEPLMRFEWRGTEAGLQKLAETVYKQKSAEPCCSSEPMPALPPAQMMMRRQTFPTPPEHRTPDIAPADIPPADYQQPPPRMLPTPRPAPPLPPVKPPKKGCKEPCNGGR